MTTPTAAEQEILEFINRARLDPLGEFDALIADADSNTAVAANITSAINYFSVDLDSFHSQLAAYDPVAPLAWNGNLTDAALGHNQLMAEQDAQEHQLDGEPRLSERIANAGYENATRASENIFAYAQDTLYAHAGFYIDWGYDDVDFSNGTLNSNWQDTGDGIQDPAGHRITILNGALTEVGVSVLSEDDPNTQVGPLLVTQNFATRSDYHPMLLGVVINDLDSDQFYDVGEGLGDILVTATDAAGNETQTTSWDSGGYQMELDPGSYTVSFSGTGLDGVASYTLTMGSENSQLYGYAANAEIPPGIVENGTPGKDALSGGAGNDTLSGGDGSDTLLGNDGDDVLIGGTSSVDLRDLLYGGEGADTLDGGYGNDHLRGDTGNDSITGGDGVDEIFGGAGHDTLTGQAWSDLIYGGTGSDFINGGFGYDRLNGGGDADRFYHLGVSDHGSDWIQDYNAAEGDVLLFGGSASRDDFQVNFSETADAGDAGTTEAFVVYRPSGQILWALVDGGAQADITLRLDGADYDLI